MGQPLMLQSRLPWAMSGVRRPQTLTCCSGRLDYGASLAPTSLAASAAHDSTATSLERIDVTGLLPSQVRDLVDFSRPCILTGIISMPDCEAWCDALMEDLGDAEVDFQIRDNHDGRNEVFRSSLVDFIHGLQDESTHDKSW